MTPSIAFVGAGPTTIYTLHALVRAAAAPFSVTIFEKEAVAGRGTPYRPGWNNPAMLSNIASVELPPLEETLVEWLERQPADQLRTFGIDHAEIDPRAYYPRLALGEYLRDQFEATIERARAGGIEVTVRTRCAITDAENRPEGLVLCAKPACGDIFRQCFDHVILATGHQWPPEPEVRPGYFLSPWPASALARIPPCRVGIRGASLTAIDAVVGVAVQYGTFAERRDGTVEFRCRPECDALSFTMISHKGLLPEANFYHPVPYEPLRFCARDAIERLIEEDDRFLLEKAFALFKTELSHADPEYAERTDLAALTIEDFCDRFFAERMAADPFEWAERNLAEARRNYETETTVGWRYAILRMHETIELIVPHLDDAAFARFSRYWKPVFIDEYADVPHESIERLLALHRVGKLTLLDLGNDGRIDTYRPQGGATLVRQSQRIDFDAFIEATGQRPLEAKDFPFRTLLQQGIIRDEPLSEDIPPRGIVIDDVFRPVSDALPADRLFCLSLPFILGRHPFSQGLTNSHDIGCVVGRRLASTVEDCSTRPAMH